MSADSPSVKMYYGAASGQQRSALRRLDPEGVMISHATANNDPFPGEYDLFVDCGGYHHMVNGSGDYEESHEAYLDYIEGVEPELFALRDYPCEPDLLNELGRSVREHQQMTTDAHVELLDGLKHRDIDAEPVAVIQGWTLEDYRRHLEQLQDHGVLDFDDEPRYVAIGSICRRGFDSEIATIIRQVRAELPVDYRLHAFGVKKNVLRYREVCEALDSADSCAYDWKQSRHQDERSTGSFTWRDSARSYLNWRHDLLQSMGTESIDGRGMEQSTYHAFATDGGGTADPYSTDNVQPGGDD